MSEAGREAVRQSLLAAMAAIEAALKLVGPSASPATTTPEDPLRCAHATPWRQPRGGFGEGGNRWVCTRCGFEGQG